MTAHPEAKICSSMIASDSDSDSDSEQSASISI